VVLGLSGWNLAGSARVASGNESWMAGGQTDANSLALPTTSTAATTPTFCVTTYAPTFRVFTAAAVGGATVGRWRGIAPA